MKTLETLTVTEARRALDAKEYTASDLAGWHLEAIEQKNPELHAYLEVYDDVRAQAARADERIARGESTPLLGIPLALKDNIVVSGKRATSGSKILEHYVAPYDATVVERLKKLGAVLLGRTNMDEFALGSSTENSAWGPTRNPHDTTRVPGGTSGGSAAAVSAHLALAALGSDTGGSIRQPASFCGVVGLKPTYGNVSRFGLMAAASSLDQIGVLAKNTEDARVVFDAIRGWDAHDSTSLPDSFFTSTPVLKKVIGVPRNFLTQGVDADVLERFNSALAVLEKSGYTIVDVTIPRLDASLAAYYIINPAEVSTNLARFDGIRYGLSVDGENISDVYKESRGAGFGKEARRRILVGTFVLSAGYADAYYRTAERVRQMLRDDFVRTFETVDAVLTPTTPTPAFKLGEKEDPLAMYAGDIFTVPVNLAGVPSVSVPAGTVVRDGVALPVGVQCIGPHGSDTALLELGALLMGDSTS